MPASNAPRRDTINLRVPADQKALIDRAAARTGRTRTEFMLDSARRAAEEALLDQRLFSLTPAGFARFAAALDAPPRDVKALRALLTGPQPWNPDAAQPARAARRRS